MLTVRNKPLEFKSIDDVFNHFFVLNTFDDDTKTPIHDVIDSDNEYIIELLLAGVKKKDTSIIVEKDELTITAERKENDKLKYTRKESYFGKYKRTFILPDTVDVDNINASMEDGILKVTIPKNINHKKLSKTIQIN